MTWRIPACLCMALLAAVCTHAPGSAASIRAVVVGIDDYANPGWDLNGAVADAHDIAGVLERRGAEVTLLIDADATRDGITQSLRRTIARSEPGDIVLFSFSGHGAQLPEALPGDETDAMDEIFLFASFRERGAAAKQLMSDNEFSLIVDSVPADVSFVIVIDACHSGTMTRSPVAFGGSVNVRTRKVVLMDQTEINSPDASTYQAERRHRDNIFYISGGMDDQLIPEVEIGGELRGALSFAVARALEGKADGGDGTTSLTDLRSFIEATVRQFANERQTPNVLHGGGDGEELSEARAAAILDLFNPQAGNQADRDGTSELPPDTFGADDGGNSQDVMSGRLEGGDDAVLLTSAPSLFEMKAGSSEDDVPAGTQIIWVPTTGELIERSTGDLLARPRGKDELAGALLKWRVVQTLKLWSMGRPAELRVIEGDQRHLVGSSVSIEISPPVSAPELRFLTLVNLAGTGIVQYIFPAPGHEIANQDVVSFGSPFRAGPIPVLEPVGSDTLIAILTDDRPTALRAALRSLDGTTAPVELLGTIKSHVGTAATARVAMKQIYTDRY